MAKEIFYKRIEEVFGSSYSEFVRKSAMDRTHGFFLNTAKADRETILSMIDFDHELSKLNDSSFYHHNDSIGKTKAYELGLIYPQGIEASMPLTLAEKKENMLVVDLCSAPGGKSINAYSYLDNAFIIANEHAYKRASALAFNFERCGLDRSIVISSEVKDLADQLVSCADLVILDAPCSGEGMIRKYPEIIDDYTEENVLSLARLQSELLDEADRILKKGGELVYSTCTFSKEENELQIENFLKRHPDYHIVKGPLRLSFLDDTEGQFMVCLKKDEGSVSSPKYRKTVRNRLVEDFIRDNLNLKDYYLYSYKDRYYLSLVPLIELKGTILSQGILLGEIVKNRFEPSHNLYRSMSLSGSFLYNYELSDKEYDLFVSGNEFEASGENHYYRLTYHGFAIGFGKLAGGRMKNKYPKGIRRMI